MSPEYDVRFCASNRISRPSLALPQTSALLCFIFVVSVSYGTSACRNDYCTSLGDHISSLFMLSPHKQPSTVLPRFMATYVRGLTSQAVNLTHTPHWPECLMYYEGNACSDRNLCNWQVYVICLGRYPRNVARSERLAILRRLARVFISDSEKCEVVFLRAPIEIQIVACPDSSGQLSLENDSFRLRE